MSQPQARTVSRTLLQIVQGLFGVYALMSALRMNKHIYCAKPVTHSVAALRTRAVKSTRCSACTRSAPGSARARVSS